MDMKQLIVSIFHIIFSETTNWVSWWRHNVTIWVNLNSRKMGNGCKPKKKRLSFISLTKQSQVWKVSSFGHKKPFESDLPARLSNRIKFQYFLEVIFQVFFHNLTHWYQDPIKEQTTWCQSPKTKHSKAQEKFKKFELAKHNKFCDYLVSLSAQDYFLLWSLHHLMSLNSLRLREFGSERRKAAALLRLLRRPPGGRAAAGNKTQCFQFRGD